MMSLVSSRLLSATPVARTLSAGTPVGYAAPVYYHPGVVGVTAGRAVHSAVADAYSAQALHDKGAFVFGQDIAEKIKHISTEAGISESEVMQRALVLMEVAVNASRSGENLAIIDKDEKVKTRITGLTSLEE